jgi:hypothetical protein
VDRRGTRDRTGDDGPWRLLLHACGRGCGNPLLDVGVALGRAAGPLAQAFELASLREHEQREHGDADDRGKRRDRPDLGEGARERKRERREDHELGECTRGAGASR